MRKIIAMLLLAATADAAPWIKDGLWFDRIPNPLPMGNGFAKFDPSEADFIATGARLPTQEEIDAREAARAAAQAEAEAQASLPAVFPNGIAVLDEASHHIEFSPTGDGLPVLGWQVSDSPLEKAKRDAMKAERKAAHDAMKAAAKGAKNNNEKIDLLMRAVFGIDE